MTGDVADSEGTTSGDAGKRAYPRVRVRVRARTGGGGAQLLARNVEIRDVGIGGMFVAARLRPSEIAPPHTGLVGADGRVHLTFALPGDGTTVNVAGRPLRASAHGFGLAFEGRFEAEAAALIDAVGGNRVYAKHEHSRANATLMADVEDVVSTWLPTRLAVFSEKAAHRLVARASSALSNAGQAPFFDAIAELKRRIADLEAAILEQLQQRLERLGAPLVVAEESSVIEEMELSLVEKEDYEVYLSIAGMAAKAESRYDHLLYRLGRYLSTLATTTIDNANNPLAPSALCDPFHESMHDAPIDSEALALIYESFEDGVVKDLEPLYTDLIELFERSGIDLAPEPPPSAPKPSESRRQEPPDAQDTHAPEPDPAAGAAPSSPPAAPGVDSTRPSRRADDGLAQSGPPVTGTTDPAQLSPLERAARHADTGAASGPPAPGVPELDLGQQLEAGEQAWAQPGEDAFATPPQPPSATPADAPTTASAVDALVPDAAPGLAGLPPAVAPAGLAQRQPAAPRHFPPRVVQPPMRYAMPAPQPGSAFGAVHALLGLRGMGQATPVTDSDAPSSEAVLGMLTNVQSKIASGGGDFRSGVRQAFGVSDDFTTPSSMGELGDAVVLVGALCDAMREDSEVSAHLAERLEQLEPAVHKVAVLDPTFFEQSNHITRQVLNQLARLVPELARANGPKTDREEQVSGFWGDVDALIAPVVERFDRDMSLFDAVLAELDLLLEAQQQTYSANLKAVIDACEAQANFIRKRRQQSGAPTRPVADNERGVSKEWSVWLRRAGRLERGEAIEFTQGDEPVRLRVAWLDEERASFVLVNARGEKAQTLSRQELAMQLRRGIAAIVRDHDLPLVDRALTRVLQEVHSSVERKATHDSGSGLLNRRAFGARLKKALDQVAEGGDGIAVIYVTLAQYDDVLSRFGADAVRLLMQRVARRVSAVTGDEDALGSLSTGDVVGFMTDTTLEQASASAEQIRTNIERMKVRWGEQRLQLTARTGVVLAPPGDDVSEVLAAAERVVADLDDNDASAPRVRTDVRVGGDGPSMIDYVTLINNTLGNERMQLRCQRVQPLETGRRVRPYFEVLLGVRDEHSNAVAAGDFIRAAHHYEQMPALDRWVLRSTFKWMAERRRWLRHVAGFSVNLSASALQGENLTEYVLELLNETGVPPGKIIFEITEAAAVQDAGPAQNFLRTLSEVGCQFALDDFGGGDGSYGYLKHLPVAYVKIDGQFTRDLVSDEANLAAVRSLCEVAHFMGKKTVAEQVETVSSLNALAGIGVNFVQGYCIEEPCYLETLEESSLKDIPGVVTTAIEKRAAETQSIAGATDEHTLTF